MASVQDIKDIINNSIRNKTEADSISQQLLADVLDSILDSVVIPPLVPVTDSDVTLQSNPTGTITNVVITADAERNITFPPAAENVGKQINIMNIGYGCRLSFQPGDIVKNKTNATITDTIYSWGASYVVYLAVPGNTWINIMEMS